MLERGKACAPCREKKLRCDGVRPTCKTCFSSGRICRYEEKRSTFLSLSDMSLLTRLEGLEARLGGMVADYPNMRGTLDTNQVRSEESRPSPIHRSDGENAFIMRLQSQPSIDASDAERDKILAIFFQYQHCIISSVDQQRFFNGMASVDKALKPHPALISAAMLVGILFAELLSQAYLLPPSTPDPETLVSRAHRELASSLEMVDRLLDYLQASNLLCFWYFCRGRLQEGKYLSSSSFRLAIDCGLHRVDACALQETQADVQSRFWDNSILGQPRDSYEINLRIMTFWQCYHWDTKLSLITGLPSSSNEKITTVWPNSLLEYTPGAGSNLEHLKSVKDLLAGGLRGTSDVLSYGHVVAWTYLGCKAIQLSLRVRTTYSQKSEQSESDIETVRSLAFATHQFAVTCKIRTPDDRHHPSLPWGNSTPSAYLLSLLTFYITNLELIRATESLCKPKGLTNGRSISYETDLYGILGPLAPQKEVSFQSAKFAIAKASIEVAHNIVVQHARHWVDNQRSSPAVMVTQVPNFSGFLLTTPMLMVVEYLHSLKGQLAQSIINSFPSTPVDLAARIRDGEAVLSMGRIVMSSLCVKLPILRFQIEKIEQALKAPPLALSKTP